MSFQLARHNKELQAMLKPGGTYGEGDEALEFYAKHTAQIEVSHHVHVQSRLWHFGSVLTFFVILLFNFNVLLCTCVKLRDTVLFCLPVIWHLLEVCVSCRGLQHGLVSDLTWSMWWCFSWPVFQSHHGPHSHHASTFGMFACFPLCRRWNADW